jgi:hypothetical protein
MCLQPATFILYCLLTTTLSVHLWFGAVELKQFAAAKTFIYASGHGVDGHSRFLLSQHTTKFNDLFFKSTLQRIMANY